MRAVATLPVADAAFLQEELKLRGIASEMHAADDGLATVEVAESDLERAAEILRSALGSESEEPEPPSSSRRNRARLAGVLGAVFVLYVGRSLPQALRGVAAVVAGLVLYALAAGGGPDPEPPAVPGTHDSAGPGR